MTFPQANRLLEAAAKCTVHWRHPVMSDDDDDDDDEEEEEDMDDLIDDGEDD